MFIFTNIAGAAATNDELVYLKATAAVASGFDESPDWAPKPDATAVIDGLDDTRWASAYKDGEWIYLDFGKPKTVSKIVIKWEQAYPVKYESLVSDNTVTWKSVKLSEDDKGGTRSIEFEPVTARYIKVMSIERVNPEWGISIWEIEAYGPKDKNPGELPREEAFKKTAADIKIDARLAAITLAPGEIKPSPGPITKIEFQKGVNYTSWDKEELAGELSDRSLVHLADLGVGHIALMAVYYQESAVSKTMYDDPKKTASDESLAHAVNMCHALGMKVMLKPHVDLVDEDARSNIIPSEEWFKNYKEFILHYAKLAAQYNVELFCVGTELSNTTKSTWKGQWLDIIEAVKKVYKGPITYASNWDEYDTVSFWNEVDYIGMDAYFPLTDKKNPSKEELVAAWERQADTLEKWLKSEKLDKGIVFTEIGYDTIEGSNREPWRILPTLAEYSESQEEQANCLDSLMTVLSNRKWFMGLYWWNYFPRPDIGPLGYTLRGKTGESVLSGWYKKIK